MKNESNPELTAAEKTWESLEATSAESASDSQVFQLGQMIRESARSVTPDTDPALRDRLLDELERVPEGNAVMQKNSLAKSTDAKRRFNFRRTLTLSTAAALVLAVGGFLWISVVSSSHQISAVSSSHQNWKSATLEKEGLLARERAARAMPLAQHESELRVAGERLHYSFSPDSEANPANLELSRSVGLGNSPKIYSRYARRLQDGDFLGFETNEYNDLPAEFLPGGEIQKITMWNGQSSSVTIWDGETWESMKVDCISKGEVGASTEQYDSFVENQFLAAAGDQAFSTFSIDVDTASYSNVRRFINSGQRPPKDSVRIEELINYFRFDYPEPKDEKPFAVSMEVADCPWHPVHRLVRVGIKGKDIHRNERPASNLVFLLDVSGSMNDADKLPLLQRGLQMMLDRLNENDRVSIVTYAGNAGVRLLPTSGDQKIKIRDVIASLAAGGSTNGSAGIEMAYKMAVENFIKDGTNRVILATDGDLNVGITDDESLVKLIKGKASEGVFLTVLGFGTGNLKDSKMEKLADNGNGVYAYIDSMREARKVLVEQMSGSLVTIAKDVKLQVEFNPGEVRAYRLLGYENRKMANADFANDKIDAGEIGAGHTVTALYEIVPADVAVPQTLSTTKFKYQQVQQATETQKPGARMVLTDAAKTGELLTLAIRYKAPTANESTRLDYALAKSEKRFYEASGDFRFAAAVASFGMLLRESRFSGDMDLAKVEKIASESIGQDTSGYRAEFVDMVRQFSNSNKK